MQEITIVAYRPEWAAEFAHLADQIRRYCRAAAQRIDHIGSTSVPDLAAKDVIDIQITVASLVTETITTTLTAQGYRHIESANDTLVGVDDTSPELEKQFLKEPEGQRRTHVHVREAGRLNQSYPLLFRDYLRTDTFTRDAYQQVKKALAQRFPNDQDAYYAIKDPYMDTVYRAAQLWAQQTDWQPDQQFR